MSQLKILVVEDEPLIAHDIKKILDQEGYDTHIDCFTVDQAISLIDSVVPDLVLIDINLNDKKNGLELGFYLNRIANIPFVFITSYSDKSTLAQASELSPSGYITKPFKPSDLISVVYLAMLKLTVRKNKTSIQSQMPFPLIQVLDYIENHIGDQITIEELAEKTGWVPDYFGKMFKQHVGSTPYQYILKIRIEQSLKLLLEPNTSLNTISYQLGFSSYSNFFNAFKKYMNMTPEEYKKILSHN